MTKTKIDYSKGLIYKFVCNDLECKDIYVGSTTNFTKRKNVHKYDCNNEKAKGYNYKVYQIIRENGGWDNWSMIEIEKYPCNDGNELRARERMKYEELKGNMNIRIPNRSQKECNEEYYKNNKEKLKKRSKIYREENTNKQKKHINYVNSQLD